MNKSILEGDNKATDVASFIINYCHAHSISITNLKLQKLLYFCEGSYLIHTKGKNACFDQHIVAWPYGPVVQSIYFKYSNYKSSEILDDIKLENKLKNEEVIRTTLDVFAPYDAYVLADITHAEKPWNDAYKNGKNTVIEKYVIYKYLTTSRRKVRNKTTTK
jgi:uncharacterized phage-associated protein